MIRINSVISRINYSFFTTIVRLTVLNIFVNSLVFTQWSANPALNTPICLDPHNQVQPQIITDGDDGAIIVWNDVGYSGATDIYAQRIDREGYIQWDERGVAICTAPNYQLLGSVVSDDNGGAYLSWSDYRFEDSFPFPGGIAHGYIQHIDMNGDILWELNGMDLNMYLPDSTYHGGCKLIKDGLGGVIGIWSDERRPSDTYLSNRDLYSQRINYDGVFLWDSTGIVIDTLQNGFFNVIGDGTGKAIISKGDYTYRLSIEGDLDWTLEVEMAQNMTYGGYGDLIWSQTTSFWNGYEIVDQITAYKINTSGEHLWGEDGVLLYQELPNFSDPKIAIDYLGGAVFIWNDSETILAQYVSNEGNTLWQENGILINSTLESNCCPGIVSFNSGEFLYLWSEELGDSVYVKLQSTNISGMFLWDDEVTLSVDDEHFLFRQDLATSNGVISVWDQFDWDINIWAQQVNKYGVLGNANTIGDLNADGQINVSDIVIAVGIILGQIIPSEYQSEVGDLNDDSQINIFDVIQIVNIILN